MGGAPAFGTWTCSAGRVWDDAGVGVADPEVPAFFFFLFFEAVEVGGGGTASVVVSESGDLTTGVLADDAVYRNFKCTITMHRCRVELYMEGGSFERASSSFEKESIFG